MVIKLYYVDTSPPSRAVLMTAKVLELPVEIVRLDFRKKEQLTEDFLKLNPTHTVPTLDDNGFVLWDSHAILPYLVDKYGKDDSLYPKNLNERALVNQMLCFDIGILFPSLENAVMPLFKGATSINEEDRAAIDTALNYLENFLSAREYLGGDHLTIADISALASVCSLETFSKVDSTKYPKLRAWLDKLKARDFYQVNEKGLSDLGGTILPLLKE